MSQIYAELVPSDRDAPLALAKARLANTSLHMGLKLMPAAGLIVAAIHALWNPLLPIAVWYMILLAVTLIYLRSYGELGATALDGPSVRRALMRFAGRGLLFVIAWASQAWIFLVSGNPLSEMSTTLIVLASSTGSVMTAAWLPAATMQAVIYVATALVIFCIRGDALGLGLGIAAIAFGSFIVGTIAHLHATTSRLLALEDEKDRLIADLRASDKSKSDFLANMSHELRTPLNAILGFSEVMKTQMLGPVGNPRYADYADDIHTSGTHLLSLINDILDLAKIEAGKFVVDDEAVDLRRVADEALRFFKLRSIDAGVTLTTRIEGDLAVFGDARALKQAITNLVSNALKFTPRGGSVSLGARRDVVGRTFLWVADTGCGISARDQAKVFQTFGQGRHDVALKEKGTGLGLAIVKGIVEAHGGTIRLDSTVGKGTSVTVCLPASRLAGADAQAA